jgi:hypothetical protein
VCYYQQQLQPTNIYGLLFVNFNFRFLIGFGCGADRYKIPPHRQASIVVCHAAAGAEPGFIKKTLVDNCFNATMSISKKAMHDTTCNAKNI